MMGLAVIDLALEGMFPPPYGPRRLKIVIAGIIFMIMRAGTKSKRFKSSLSNIDYILVLRLGIFSLIQFVTVL